MNTTKRRNCERVIPHRIKALVELAQAQHDVHEAQNSPAPSSPCPSSISGSVPSFLFKPGSNLSKPPICTNLLTIPAQQISVPAISYQEKSQAWMNVGTGREGSNTGKTMFGLVNYSPSSSSTNSSMARINRAPRSLPAAEKSQRADTLFSSPNPDPEHTRLTALNIAPDVPDKENCDVVLHYKDPAGSNTSTLAAVPKQNAVKAVGQPSPRSTTPAKTAIPIRDLDCGNPSPSSSNSPAKRIKMKHDGERYGTQTIDIREKRMFLNDNTEMSSSHFTKAQRFPSGGKLQTCESMESSQCSSTPVAPDVLIGEAYASTPSPLKTMRKHSDSVLREVQNLCLEEAISPSSASKDDNIIDLALDVEETSSKGPQLSGSKKKSCPEYKKRSRRGRWGEPSSSGSSNIGVVRSSTPNLMVASSDSGKKQTNDKGFPVHSKSMESKGTRSLKGHDKIPESSRQTRRKLVYTKENYHALSEEEDAEEESDDSARDPHWKSTTDSLSSDEVDNVLSLSDDPEVVQNGPICNRNSSLVQSPVPLEPETEESSNYPCKKKIREERAERRKLRETGQEYNSSGKKVYAARKPYPLSPCRKKCCEKISREQQQEICKEYWGFGKKDRRDDFLASHIRATPTATHSINSTRKRGIAVHYHLLVNGNLVEVCKKCFLYTLDETDRVIRNILEKKEHSVAGTIQLDKRGKHPNKNKTPDDVLGLIKAHINSFPAYESHYSRRQTKKLYLAGSLTITSMHKLFCDIPGHPKISFSVYQREFQKTGLKFKMPHADTCNKCDAYKIKLQVLTGEELKQSEEERMDHWTAADRAYVAMKKDSDDSCTDPKMMTVAFDLQQVLSCPKLTANQVFYLRQLSVYNLTVHEFKTCQSINFMWHEAESGRGSNEIGSSLLRYITKLLPPTVKHLVLYSDQCSGQNKNSQMCATYQLALAEKPTLETIDHKFLVSGHTHMACDRDHAAIEKMSKRSEEPIYLPTDWYSLVRKTKRVTQDKRLVQFQVEEMRGKMFDLRLVVKSILVMRDKDINGNKFKFSEVQWFRAQRTHPGILFYKKSLSVADDFKQLNMKRRGFKSSAICLKNVKKCPATCCISSAKKDDLKKLFNLIHPDCHSFYQQLQDENNLPDIDPDLPPDDEDLVHAEIEGLLDQSCK